ncbi:MAG: polysaccharide biosynthesis C-terminal domain-containing protein, partial [Sedimentisphaerales bacterium]|nr:polysaccharide biosynthesis C-terminal domain-containing protein [Sedimentisphaerales bacterium]
IPPTALAVICSGTILTFVYGAEYSAVAVPFGLLCVYVVLLIQGNTLAGIFLGIGQPAKNRAFVGLRALVLVVLIYPGIKLFGLTGAAAVVVLASFTAMCLQLAAIHKTIGLNIFNYATSWLPGLVLAVPILVTIVVVQRLKPGCPMVHLTVGALSCIIVCLTGLLLLRRFDGSGQHAPRSIAPVEFTSGEESQRV